MIRMESREVPVSAVCWRMEPSEKLESPIVGGPLSEASKFEYLAGRRGVMGSAHITCIDHTTSCSHMISLHFSKNVR